MANFIGHWVDMAPQYLPIRGLADVMGMSAVTALRKIVRERRIVTPTVQREITSLG